MSELPPEPPEEPPSGPDGGAGGSGEPGGGNVATPVPVDSPLTRDGDVGAPPDTLPPPPAG
ncbi:hypothetical protein GCM10010420_21790 [Streptomyces glaucosporus]|uniref:Uncharacterized protein n=1 Tax=Streptomyces glaucosporus TaxID=284044 RepID=A0ABN3I8E5_9ACTN